MNRIAALACAVLVSTSAIPAPALGAEIRLAGICANSGQAGDTLVTHGTYPRFDWNHLRGRRYPGMGVGVDAHGHLWARAALDQLNRYAVDGRMLAHFPIPEHPGHWGDCLAVAGGKVFLQVNRKLFSLPTDAPSGTAPQAHEGEGWQISRNTYKGRLVAVRGADLLWIDPAAGPAAPFLTLPHTPDWPHLDVMPDGTIYVFGRKKTWRVQGGNAEELEQRRMVQWLDGHWYSFGWHGTIRRYAPDFRADPGVVLGGNSGSFIGRVPENSEIIHPTGLAKVADDLFAVSGMDAPLFLMQWRGDAQQFELVRRIGGIGPVRTLGLDRDGRIWARGGVWNWLDTPAAPSGDAGNAGNFGQAVLLPNDMMVAAHVMHGKSGLVMGTLDKHVTSSKQGWDKLPLPRPFWGTAWYKGKEGKAQRGVLLVTNEAGAAHAFAVQPHPRGAWSCYSGDLGPVALKTETPVKRWGSLAMHGADTLLVAADDQVIAFQRDKADWKETGRFSGPPGDAFGARIEIGCDAGRLWVADTERHRVLCFDAATHKLLGTFGTRGRPGNRLHALDRPTTITPRGTRCVVYDSNNYRLVKLELVAH